MDRQQNAAPYFLHQGTNYKAYEYLGVHHTDFGMYTFRVWAPGAVSVFVVGDFCGWETGILMKRVTEGGVWEVSLRDKNIRLGDKYKYKIFAEDGSSSYRADPYAFSFERQPADASVIYELDRYPWKDAGWLSYRRKKASSHSAMNIYELELGAYLRRENGELCSYSELAESLAPYVKQMGYTHIALTDIQEYIFDQGKYEVYGHYAPTSRFGAPKEFMSFVDSMHEAGIGIVMSFSASSFPTAALGEYDGQELYESNSRSGKRFDLGRKEVECFLASSACFWLDKYHIDGLKLDGLPKLLTPIGGKRKQLELLSFFRKINSHIKVTFPGAVMIADSPDSNGELTAFEDGGLGFDIVRNISWTNHTLGHAAKEPSRRKGKYRITDSMVDLLEANTLLAISRDDIGNGQGSFIDRMGGDYREKFAGARLTLGYMMTYPGHKLVFSGCEFGQFKEYRRGDATEWFLLDFDSHAKLQLYSAELGALYLKRQSLQQGDFELISCEQDGILCYRRIGACGEETVVVLNHTAHRYDSLTLGIPEGGIYKEIFNSDDRRYGGDGVTNIGDIKSRARAIGEYKNSIKLSVPPLAITILTCVGRTQKKRKSK